MPAMRAAERSVIPNLLLDQGEEKDRKKLLRKKRKPRLTDSFREVLTIDSALRANRTLARHCPGDSRPSLNPAK
jgi:hypothetical protein